MYGSRSLLVLDALRDIQVLAIHDIRRQENIGERQENQFLTFPVPAFHVEENYSLEIMGSPVICCLSCDTCDRMLAGIEWNGIG